MTIIRVSTKTTTKNTTTTNATTTKTSNIFIYFIFSGTNYYYLKTVNCEQQARNLQNIYDKSKLSMHNCTALKLAQFNKKIAQ